MSCYIEMYTKKNCPYCERARILLIQKSLNFKEIFVDDGELGDVMRLEMNKRSGRNTVPQIFINDQHIGGADDLMSLNQSGKLDCLLRN